MDIILEEEDKGPQSSEVGSKEQLELELYFVSWGIYVCNILTTIKTDL